MWFFDIRSFDKLIRMNQLENPYTRQTIPKDVIERGNQLIQLLKSRGQYENMDIDITKYKLHRTHPSTSLSFLSIHDAYCWIALYSLCVHWWVICQNRASQSEVMVIYVCLFDGVFHSKIH